MDLHTRTDEFLELITFTADETGLPEIYIEKDYWVTRALKCLAESDLVDDVIFKGGTSLSKAYRLIERFSEDVDLAVFAGERSGNALKKHIKDVENIVNKGLSSVDSPNNSKGGKFRRTVYEYPRTQASNDFGQASPHLLLEINAFTNPEPHETRELNSLIAEALEKKERLDLVSRYGLESFTINVLSVRRTLTEKLLRVIKASYADDPVSELSTYIRHLYDITMILRDPDLRMFMEGEEFLPMCQRCIEDDKIGNFSNSGCLDHPLLSAPLFSHFSEWQEQLNTVYTREFAMLVNGGLPEFDEITQAVDDLQQFLATVSAN
ncbi:MAG: hypothetical protein CMI09_11280 [Oceanospirillaceae bacterium]|nr:hypothetical protein [Oceanospirillaceae bacterium]